MKCKNPTSPVNITTNTAIEYTGKCRYSFNYSRTNISARIPNKNYIEYNLTQTTSNKGTGDAIFRNADYLIDNIRLYRPSLHTYGGSKADAELIISHNNITNSSGSLMVCVPISKGSRPFNSALNNLITGVANLCPGVSECESSKVTLDKRIPLNDLVLYKPFYSYKGTPLYGPCNGTQDYVVFYISDALGISDSTYTKLTELINETNFETYNEAEIFYNKDGPFKDNEGGTDDIYIECKPTGVSEDEMLVNMGDKDMSSSIRKYIKSESFETLLIIFAVFIAIIILLKVANIIFNKLGGIKGGGQLNNPISE